MVSSEAQAPHFPAGDNGVQRGRGLSSGVMTLLLTETRRQQKELVWPVAGRPKEAGQCLSDRQHPLTSACFRSIREFWPGLFGSFKAPALSCVVSGLCSGRSESPGFRDGTRREGAGPAVQGARRGEGEEQEFLGP